MFGFCLTSTVLLLFPAVTPAMSPVHDPAKQQTPSQQTVVEQGVWGGPGIRLQVTKEGAEIEYDCAQGRILEPITLDAEGKFMLKGIHLRNRPGPIRIGEHLKGQSASFSGGVKGETMTLAVTLTAKSENIGNFTLTRGSEGRLRKCL
jgi:hypothetical protein